VLKFIGLSIGLSKGVELFSVQSLSLYLVPLMIVALGVMASPVMAEQKVSQDYHLTTYAGQQDSISDIGLFTKQSETEAFFGVTCSSMTPFPYIQILLFNDEVLSETPKFLKVAYTVDGKVFEQQPALQGILQVVDTADEYSNKVRLELVPNKVRSLTLMNQGYQQLLEQLKAGQSIEVSISSRAFGTKDYQFSLKGLKTLIEPHQAVCR